MSELGRKKRIIQVDVHPDGSTTVEAINFEGKGCRDATRPFEEALGTVVADRDKPEIRRQPAAAEERAARRNTL